MRLPARDPTGRRRALLLYDLAVPPSPTIAIWGHYHGGNLGDELVVAILVDAIRTRLPEARVIGISMLPDDTVGRHGIEAFPINPDRRLPSRSPLARTRVTRALAGKVRAISAEALFVPRCLRLLRTIDLLVVAGSGQLLDEWDGPWLHPYTTYRWAVLARRADTMLVIPSVGAGPIDARLSASFIRRALAQAAYVSVRDAASRRTLEEIGVRRSLPVYPDMGFGIPAAWLPDAAPRASAGGSAVRVGLNVMAHQDPRYWPRGERHRYHAFLEKMTRFTSWLLKQGFEVQLFSSQRGADRRVADDLLCNLELTAAERERLGSLLDEIVSVDDLLRALSSFDVVVAGRYHSVLLPLLLDIPVVGLAYNPKTSELLAAVGAPERCLDADAFTFEELVGVFESVLGGGEAREREHLRRRVAEQREAVLEQFDRLFGERQLDELRQGRVLAAGR